MSPSFIDDLAEIIATIGHPADAALRARVFRALGPSGIPDESYLPTYFTAGIHQLATREPSPWTDVPAQEIGLSWLLRDLVPLLSGAVFLERQGLDTLAVPALGLALSIQTSRTKDRWAVVTHFADGTDQTAPAGLPQSLTTFDPTREELERWGGDPRLRLALEDERVALTEDRHLEQLARLAANATTVKLSAILAALDELVILGLWREGEAGLRRIDDVFAHSRRTHDDELPVETRAWLSSLRTLREYVQGSGEVSLADARSLAQELLLGRRHPAAAVAETERPPWWQFAAAPPGAAPREYLYVHSGTGALRWSAIPLTAAQLAQLDNPKDRLVRAH